MVQPAFGHGQHIVDLTSDDGNDDRSDDGIDLQDTLPSEEFFQSENELDADELDPYGQVEIDNLDIVDLTAIPDVDVPPSEYSSVVVEDPVPTDVLGEAELITEAVCLQMVLNVFPDVSVDHVLTMIQERTTDLTRTKEHSELIVNELLEGAYPKEAEATSKKRRRQDSEGPSDWESNERNIGAVESTNAIELLKDEFLPIPVRHIVNTFKEHKTLFRTYIILEEQLRNYQQITRTFTKTSRTRTKRGVELSLIEAGNQLPKELNAAKKRVENNAVKRRKLEETQQAEEANLERARMENLMGECQCCFTEYPLNRMISCSGDAVHLFCMDCPKQYIETEMGQSRCRPECFASTECKGTFSRAQLQQVLDIKSFERLEHMQQQQDIAAAGLDFLSECPFCDFKAECPPVEEDREFRCQNVKCGKTSCRLCDKETHIPLSCEEAKKDGQLTLRHVVEEAMSAALIRKCNNCQRPFIKEFGCNKMSCSNCGNKQCYICSKNVKDYEHFGDTNKGRCALHDNVEEVHEQAVKKAADDAMAQVRAENPGLSDADLMVQVSDRVKQAEAMRKGRAAERLNEFPFEMQGDQLAHRFGFPGAPPPRAVANAAQRPPLGGAVDLVYHGMMAAGALANHAIPIVHFNVQHLHEGQGVAPQPNAQPRRRHLHFRHAIVRPAPLEHHARAAQDRFQHALQQANPQRVEAEVDMFRRVDRQAALDQVDARRAARHLRRVENMQNQLAELQRRQQEFRDLPPLPAQPAFGVNGPAIGAQNAGAAAGAGGGLAFVGQDFNRALGPREQNRRLHQWLGDQMREGQRQ